MLDLIADYKLAEKKENKGIRLRAAQYYSEWMAEHWFEGKAWGAESGGGGGGIFTAENVGVASFTQLLNWLLLLATLVAAQSEQRGELCTDGYRRNKDGWNPKPDASNTAFKNTSLQSMR